MKKEKYIITGMSCSACSSRVEKCERKLQGVDKVSVNLLTNSMQITYDESIISSADIIKAAEKEGYGASLATGNQVVDKGKKGAQNIAAEEIREMKARLLWSFIFLIPMMYISMHKMLSSILGLTVPTFMLSTFDGSENALVFAFTQLLLVLPIMYLNRTYYTIGFKNLLQGAPNMDSLIAVGSGAAAFYGVFAIFRIGYGLGHGYIALVNQYSADLYFESAGMILTLITLGKFLESKSKGKTSEAIEKLMNLAPKAATIERAGQEVIVPVEELVVGDIVLVKPGESIAADGIIVEGKTSIDEAAITGESIPVEKHTGDKVVAATINKNGFIKFRAEKVGDDTTISQIIKLVDEASGSKAPIAKLADKIAGIFVPIVMLIALMATIGWLMSGASFEFALSIGISVLVISCPCALGLATPVAIMVGTGKGAENGILIKSGEALEIAHSIDTVVMDKTGTITEGKPRVTDVIPVGIGKEELLSIAAGIEKGSEHPLAEAIIEHARQKEIVPQLLQDFQTIFGRGIQAIKDSVTYFAGNEVMLTEKGVNLTSVKQKINDLADEGKTPLIFARGQELLGIIAVADVEKATSKEAIKLFKDMNINVVMLTGDNKRTAEALRKRLQVPEVIAGVMPEDKAKHIEKLQLAGHKVAMIGDGINDAPALARADLGIAIGAGTDVAIESADAVLVRNDLLDAVSAVRLSKAVMRNIKQNLFWAFFYNMIGIPLAAGLLYPEFGLKLSPMFGAAAMSMSSVCVVLNALRLRYFHIEHSVTINENKESKEKIKMETKLKIEGMMCAHCQKHVHDALSAMEGVMEVEVDLEGGKAKVTAVRNIATEEFAKVIADAGYTLVK
ncbi:MAG: heavy metal translocating P-type ATPase [Acidaminococcaceae bacterium]|nr:heavy metal translocating P-type ATPase [Acidaminococcaceae bacterium]MDD4721185.1 heavy metal translocating P-type ATPase [Acidaminococcaceae bacterium]